MEEAGGVYRKTARWIKNAKLKETIKIKEMEKLMMAWAFLMILMISLLYIKNSFRVRNIIWKVNHDLDNKICHMNYSFSCS